MDEQTKRLVAVAVVGGYVLGRTRKGRLALTAATVLMGRQWASSPRGLVTEGIRRINELPQVADLRQQVRDEALLAGRKALSAVADRSLGSLADAIGSRTASLGGTGTEDGEPAEDEEDTGEEPGEEEAEDHRRRRPRGTGGSETSGSRSGKRAAKDAPSAGRTGQAERTPRKKAAKKSAPPSRRRR